MKQVRLFTLSNDGEIKYYKDGKSFKGGFWLSKDCKCLKVARGSIEIRTPGRTYFLEEIDKKTSKIDEWIKLINEVIQTL